MTQPTGQPGAPGQPPQGVPPPSWQQAPQAPQPPAPQPQAPPSWQQAPQAPQPPAPASWQQAPQQPVPPAPPQSQQPPSWTASLTSTAPIAGPAGFVYGDVPNRSIAYIIDFIVLFIIGLVISIITLAIFGDKVGNTQSATMLSVLTYQVLWYALIAAYFWYTWTKMRATVGMRLLGMQIGHEVDGRTIDNNQAMIRVAAMFGPGFVAGVLSAFALGLGTIAQLVAFIWFLALLYTTAKSPTHQGLHDQYAHTMVVKTARRAG